MNRFSPTGVGNVHYPIRRWRNASGSAPLVWGTCGNSLFSQLLRRFSPTGVGNVAHCAKPLTSLPVQPHWCGERDRMLWFDVGTGGSAPLVWGTLPILARFASVIRFSPTGVGNVRRNESWQICSTVQPHWCGERIFN